MLNWRRHGAAVRACICSLFSAPFHAMFDCMRRHVSRSHEQPRRRGGGATGGGGDESLGGEIERWWDELKNSVSKRARDLLDRLVPP